MRLRQDGRLEVLAYSESMQRLMHRNRPVCRRCGRKVDAVSTRLAADVDALDVAFSCHGVHVVERFTRQGAEHIKKLWPAHVFEYEATSFGSWDANGSEVSDA